MNKPRLFLLGDSFVDWDIPKYHWTYYLNAHFEVHKFAKYGADNYSIIFQLGKIPEYRQGDRILFVFTEPGRLPRRFYGDRYAAFESTPYMSPSFYKNTSFAENLHLLKYDESERWVKRERLDEINFLKNLKIWLHNYSPVFTTWSDHFHSPVRDFVTLIQVSSNAEEKVGDSRDFHPGPKGCYEMYKIVHTLLNVQGHIVPFKKENKLL